MNEEMNKIEKNEKISIKVYYDEDCRRFSVSENITYDELCELLEEILSVEFKKDQYTLRYKDEEDEFIFFSTDLELSEAFKFAQKNEMPILRLFVSGALELEQEQEKETEFEQERYYDSSDSSTSSDEEDLLIPYLPRKLYKELQEFLLQMQQDLDKLLKNELFTKLLESNYLQILQEYQQIIANGEKQTKLFSNYLDKLLENVEIEPEIKDKIKNMLVLIAQKLRTIKENHPKFPFEMIFKNISKESFPDLLKKIKEGCQNKFQRKVHKRKCKHEKKWKKYLKDNKEKNVDRKFPKEKKWKKYKNRKYGKKQHKYLKYKYGCGKKQCFDPMDDEFNKKKFRKCKNKCNQTKERGRGRFGGRRRRGFGGRGRGRGRGRGYGRRRFSDDFYINMNNNAYSYKSQFTKDYDHKFLKKKYSKEKKEQKRIERQQWKLYKKQLQKEKRDFKKQLRKQKKLFKNKLRKEKKQLKSQRKQNTKHYRKNYSKHYRNKFHQVNFNKKPFYQEELTILENIGFVNRDLNLELLKSYNGDVKQTIQVLLNSNKY